MDYMDKDIFAQQSHHALIYQGLSESERREVISHIRSSVDTDIGSWHSIDTETLSIDDVRVLKRWHSLSYTGQRVAIIIAHAIGLEASNALLKTLEEPKGETKFIFFLPRGAHILPTIASRVRIIHITKQSPEGHPESDQNLVTDFITAPLGRRIEMAKEISEDRAQANQFILDLEQHIAKSNTRVRKVLKDVTSYMRDRGASIKQLLERLALCRFN